MAAERTYRRTHPWIKFDIRHELEHLSPKVWILLGEARSKCEHLKYVPLKSDTAANLHRIYFAKGVMATTAIEGNTLSEEQVQQRMQGQLELPPSKEYLGREIDNMVESYNAILHRLWAGQQVILNRETLCGLNKSILARLDVDDDVVPGELRTHSVAVGPYLCAPSEDLPFLVDRLCDWLEEMGPGDGDERIPKAFIQAAVAHVYLEWIHPFGDGNGRLGRLVEFLILIRSGVPSAAAHILPTHHNDTRTDYYRQLHQASRGSDLRPFIAYAAQGFVDGLREAIKQLHRQQESLMWQSLVDDAFHEKGTPAAHRQRHLAVELGNHHGGLARRNISTLTPTLAEMYVGKTSKTLSRDLNHLETLELITIAGRAVVPRIDRVRGMRPFAVD